MKTALHLVGSTITNLCEGILEDVLPPDIELDGVSKDTRLLELGELLLEVDSLVVKVKQVRHVSDQTLQFIHKQIGLRLDHLVDDALVDHAEA